MINLEWLRTFRAVYRTKSLSRASEMLHISQPTVSQQISNLEAHLGQKLFNRKSKGVLETDDGRMLNTLISGAIESLEEVENQISQKASSLKTIITIGVSPHLYKTTLCHQILDLGEHVHVKFGSKQSLITDVEEGRLLYALVPEEVNTFDIICQPLYDQKLIMVASPSIEMTAFPNLYRKDKLEAEKFLNNQKWYAHDSASGYIKLYWITKFDKKRPAIIPNYVIPNEYEVLFQQAQGKGLSIALDSNAIPFLEKGHLQKVSLPPVPFRKLCLISNKKRAPKDLTEKIAGMLSKNPFCPLSMH